MGTRGRAGTASAAASHCKEKVISPPLPAADKAFLDSLKAQDTEGYRVAIRALFKEVDARLRAGLFSEVDALLEAAPVQELHPVVAMGFLTITLFAKNKLPHRAALGERVRELLMQRMAAEGHTDVKCQEQVCRDLEGIL